MGSVCESTVVAIFVVKIAMDLPEYMSLFVMNGVFPLSICSQIHKTAKRINRRGTQERSPAQRRPPVKVLVMLVAALVLSVIGVILTACFFATNEFCYLIPICLVLLSFAWSTFIQERQLYPNKERLREAMEQRSQENQGGEGIANILDDPLELIVAEPHLSARWKITILTTFLKLLLIPGFVLLFGYLFKTINVSLLYTGFAQIRASNDSFPSFLLSILTSFVGYLVGWVACVMGMHKLAFVLPLIFATPLSLGFRMLQDFCVIQVESPCHPKYLTREEMYLNIPAAVCLYLAQILSTVVFIYETDSLIMPKESQVRYTELVECLFLQNGYESASVPVIEFFCLVSFLQIKCVHRASAGNSNNACYFIF